MSEALIKSVEATDNPEIPDLFPGDTVSVFVRITEGQRERVQEFRGTVIRLKKGGNNASVTIRRTASHGIGVERSFLIVLAAHDGELWRCTRNITGAAMMLERELNAYELLRAREVIFTREAFQQMLSRMRPDAEAQADAPSDDSGEEQ